MLINLMYVTKLVAVVQVRVIDKISVLVLIRFIKSIEKLAH